jgi:hypothetical protein
LALAGVAAGFAAWTKNEGLLFLFAFLVSQFASTAWARPTVSGESRLNAVRELAVPLLAMAPFLLLIAWFKHSVAPGDLFSSPDSMIHKILSPTRYWTILQWYVKEFFRFGNWVIPTTVLLLALGFLIPRSGIRRDETAFRSPILPLALTLAGYFAIYVITPNDLYWHLRFSLNRLFLQVWPSTLFLFFLFAGGQTCAESQIEPNSTPKPGQSVKNFVRPT